MQHLVQLDHSDRLAAAMAAHPSAGASPAVGPAPRRAGAADRLALRDDPDAADTRRAGSGDRELRGVGHVTAAVAGADTAEDGSLVTEYGLLAVVAATVAGVVIQWASGGALVTLFNALLRHARSLVGA
ncbi:MAG: hypothetical protein EA387_15510 [Nitriliruptor sp.]|nr:MAG: hypothetical protein EA387_15510 [Nitriliruptor sp.]